jgi:hypothetical protein
MRRLYAIAVVKCGIPPKYFLDEMSTCELEAVLEYANETEKQKVELRRLGWYYSILPYAQKGVTPQKLIPLSWEKEEQQAARPLLTQEEITERATALLNAIPE